jgi:hypothetical protein
MPIKRRNQVKILTAASGGSLRADEDEAFLIRDIFCVPSASDDYLTLYCQGVTVGLFRVKGLAGNHLPFPFIKTAQIYEHLTGGLLAWLRSIGLDLSYPVASGQTFTVSRYAEAGLVVLVYDVYESADVLPDAPNGTQSNVRRYLHYVTNLAAITATPAVVDLSLIWSGGEAWPVSGQAVAERNRFRLFGILGAPTSHGDASANKGCTTHLQLIHRNNVLFDEDRGGLPFNGEVGNIADAASYISEGSVVGPLTAENPAPGLVLDPPLEFVEGDKLTTQLVLANAAADGIAASEIDLAFVLEHTYGE